MSKRQESSASFEVLLPREAAALLRISLKTLWVLSIEGSLPGARKVGNSWRYSRGALLRWLESQQAVPATAGGADNGK